MDQAAYFREHPPRCIAGFEVQPVELVGVVFDGHGEELNPTFSLTCKCQGTRFLVFGHYRRNLDALIFVSPLALKCASCETITHLFDIAIHGHDAQFGSYAASIRGDGPFEEFRCSECGPLPMEVFSRFEFPDDLFDEDVDDYRGREQEFFTWFSLHGKCTGCGQMIDITEIECA